MNLRRSGRETGSGRATDAVTPHSAEGYGMGAKRNSTGIERIATDNALWIISLKIHYFDDRWLNMHLALSR